MSINLLDSAPQAILFDLDGTLIDSAPALGQAANLMRTHRQKVDLPIDRYRPMAGAGAAGILSIAFQIDAEHPDFAAMREEYLNTYESLLFNGSPVFEGITDVIDFLQKERITWGIVTNKHERFTHPLVKHIPELKGYSILICGDTTEHSKPHPLPLTTAASELNIAAEQCWYIGDDLRDMQAAKAANMFAIAAQWGYLGNNAVEDWPHDALLSTPRKLLDMLRDVMQ